MGSNKEGVATQKIAHFVGPILGLWVMLLIQFLGTAMAQIPSPTASPSPGASSTRGSGSDVNVSGRPMHVSASRSVRDLKNNRLELFGNVYIRRPQELLTSDYAVLDLKNERLIAEGNVVYFTPNSVIYGRKMDFNYVLGTGRIEDGRVESDRYQLMGDELHRLAEDEFYGREADYTTCRDCPASWKIHGRSIRMTVQGYARISQMLIKINDNPVLYFPFLIIPVKTERQTGLLFPKFRTGSVHGFQYIQPFFWAISKNQDATLGFGKLTRRGYKGELEHRYALGSRSSGQTQAYLLQDRSFIEPYQRRWALNSTHNLELPGKVDLKFQWLDASDRDYPRFFPEDIPGENEPALISQFGLSKATRDLSVWFDAKRIKRLLRRDLVGFDHQQVQQVPSISIATNDHRITKWFPLYWGVNFNYSRFWRQSAASDILDDPTNPASSPFFTPGRDPLRKAHRLSLIPEIYYTAKFFDVIEFVPSFEYRSLYYVFDEADVTPLRRGYPVARAELATSFERVYGGTVKHRLRPALTYTAVPFRTEDPQHPFTRQLEFGASNISTGLMGRQFDDYDIVPYSEAPPYFIPIGNALTYEIGNHFIMKSWGDDGYVISDETRRQKGIAFPQTLSFPSYSKIVDFRAGQTINFVEFRKNSDERPFSRAYAIANVSTKPIVGTTEVYYYPYSRAFTVSAGATYFLARYAKRLLNFQRSFSLSYSRNKVTAEADQISAGLNWSINDYISVALSRSMDLLTARTLGTTGQIIWQSPSQCYQLSLLVSNTIARGLEISPNLVINLTGAGFTSLTDPGAASSVAPQR